MRTIVGREAPKTYWRRRAIVAGAALALVGVTLYACGGSGGEPGQDAQPASGVPASPAAPAEPDPAPAPSSTLLRPFVGDAPPSVSLSASGPVGTVPGGPCADTDVKLEPVPASASIPKGGYLTVEVKVTNAAAVPCVRDLGLSQQELQVKAGKERLWSTDDCSGAGEANRRTLQPGETVSSRVTWDGRTSTPGCHGGSRAVPAGTYQVVARLGSAWSAPVDFKVT